MKISPEWEERMDALPQGIFFTSIILVFVALALFLALLYHQFELTLFALTLLVLALGLKLWSRFSTRHLIYRLAVDKQKVFPGEKIDFRVVIENNKLLPVLVETRLLLPRSLVPDDREHLVRERSGALWHQTISFRRELRPSRRGVYRSGAPRLITGDFFGFFPRPTPEEHQIDILVFPRPIRIRNVPVLNRIMFGKKGDSSPIRDPIRILGTRDYRSFSSAREIHWKATARHHKLQEKIFEVTEQEQLSILLEADGFVDHGDETVFERAIEVIGALASQMAAEHYAIGFLTNCGMHDRSPRLLSPARNPGHIPALFEMLAKIEFNGAVAMNDFLTRHPYPFAGSSSLYFSYEPIKGTSPVRRANQSLVNVICRPDAARSTIVKKSPVRSIFLEEIHHDT
jgi:uncharacterized protein (DUF58 family)